MADFTTLGANFAVRVNDGFKWAVYHLTATSERDAHAAAQTLWRDDPGKTRHSDEPMPTAAPEAPTLSDESMGRPGALDDAHAQIDKQDELISKLNNDLAAAQRAADEAAQAKTVADARIHDLEADNAELHRSLEAATAPRLNEPQASEGGDHPA